MNGGKAMVGDDEHGDCGVGCTSRLHQLRYQHVQLLEIGVRLRTERPMEVLLFIQRAEVYRHESGAVATQNVDGEARACTVALDCGVIARHVGAEPRLHLLERALGTADGVHQEALLRVCICPCDVASPVLGDVVIDGVSVDGNGPTDAGGADAGGVGGLPERLGLDAVGVPVPGAVEVVFGIEDPVVQDAVLCGPHACDERCVARVGDGRKDSAYTVGIAAVTHEAAQRGQLEPVVVGMGDVVRAHAIDRDHEDGAVRLRRGGQGRGEDKQGCSKSGQHSVWSPEKRRGPRLSGPRKAGLRSADCA